MKNLVFVLTAILTIGFLSSCNKEDNEVGSTEVLIEEITNSSAKQNVEPADLPENSKTFVEDEYFESYVETVSYVDGKGYEVTMGTEDVEYFDTNGNVLRTDRNPRRCHRPGPCGGGERIAVTEIPQNIVTYITDNYPDQEIRRAKIKGDYYLIGITGPTVLVFQLDGTFELEAPLFRFCHGVRINIDNLPEVITTYISDNCPDGEIKAAFRIRGRVVVGVLTPEGRKILVFSNDGEFLFERP